MELATYSAIKQKLYDDLDLHDEDFITEAEFLGYLNEGIDDIESIIHNLGLEARYFKTNDTLTLSSGTSDYDPPTDIYGSKYIGLYYINGSKKYKVFRRRNQDDILLDTTGADYEYDIFNLTAGIKLRFYPTPAEAGSYIHRYYIRNIRKLTTSTAGTNTCELPESINFLYAHTRVKVEQKENKGMASPDALATLKVQRDLMVEGLQEMTQENQNTIIPDLSFYEDMSLDYQGGF